MEEHSHCASWDALPLKGIKVTSSIRKSVCFANVRKKMGISGKIFNEYKFAPLILEYVGEC